MAFEEVFNEITMKPRERLSEEEGEYLLAQKRNRGMLEERLGVRQGKSAMEELNRSAFKDDEAYLDAVTRRELEQKSAAYRATRRRFAAQLAEQKKAEMRQAQRDEYNRLSRSICLDSVDLEAIEKKAAELAQQDLTCRRIFAEGLAGRIDKYRDELIEKRKAEKATSQMFNRSMRL